MPWKQDPKPITSAANRNAKAMRKSATDSEKRLWLHIRRALSLQGTHFRRQVPLGPYIADFCCHGAKLIVEVDGDQHGADHAITYDAKRTAYLEAQGFRVLRFTNLQVLREIGMVIDTVAHETQMLHDQLTPTPTPSPQGGGESASLVPQP